MKAIFILLSVMFTLAMADIRVYQYSGVDVKHKGKQITIEREISPKCLDIPISNDMIWESSYAGEKIPEECKAVFVTSVGQIQPMSVHPKVETYGEMEVMKFSKQMQHDDSMMLVDTRAKTWFNYRTIPGAVNISHSNISQAQRFPEGFKKALAMLGVKSKGYGYDYENAKTIVLFCNGAWCSQSPEMIKKLITLGYPPEKLKWYRGGMNDWLMLSMTVTQNMEND